MLTSHEDPIHPNLHKVVLADGTIKIMEGYHGNLFCNNTTSYKRHCNILIFLVCFTKN